MKTVMLTLYSGSAAPMPGLFMNYLELLIILLFFNALEDGKLSLYKQ